MEKRVYQKIIICDGCGDRSSSGILSKCPACKKEVCYQCGHQLYDVFHTDICKQCLTNPKIEAALKRRHEQWLKQANRLRGLFSRLGKLKNGS